MDINQAARMIEWLDEERRRDKGNIARLEEQISQQQELITTLTRRLGSMESEQTMLQTHVEAARRNTGEDVLDMVRKEMRNLLEQQEAKRLTAEREAERRSQIERDNLARPIDNLSERLNTLERQLLDMPATQNEQTRTGEVVASVQQRIDDLNKKMEDPERRITLVEEQRRTDNRRLSEIQSELPEIQKQIDGLRPKLMLIEELALRNERKINDTQTAEGDRRDQIQQFIEQQTLMLQQRDMQVQSLMEQFGEQDSTMQRNLERFEQWSETYREMKRVLDDFERIGDRLERRINEVSEMQRLSEERFRKEWNDWREEDQKRFKQYTLANDEVWRNHDQEFERHMQKVNQIENLIPPLQESIKRMWDLERARTRLYTEQYGALMNEYDTEKPKPSPSTTTGVIPAIRSTSSDIYPVVPPLNDEDE